MKKKLIYLGIILLFLLLNFSTICPLASIIKNTNGNNGPWSELCKITEPDIKDDENFGTSLSTYKEYVIAGVPSHEINGEIKGAAFIYKRNGNNWEKQHKLIASDGKDEDWFGESTAISDNYAIIGAPGENTKRGAVYIYKRNDNSWIEVQKLIASDGESGDYFGGSVALDGNYLIVGAEDDENENCINGYSSGAAYIFEKEDNLWIEKQKIIASDGECGDEFGTSISISGDYAIIGAPYAGNGGAAYIFKISGSIWTEQQKLTHSYLEQYDYFGSDVSIDGDYALIGARGDDKEEGAAYVFKRDGNSWTEQQVLKAHDAGVNGDFLFWGRFGTSVSISRDYAIISAPYTEDWMGGAYIFKRDGNSWTEQQKIIPSDGDAYRYYSAPYWEHGDKFGSSVEIYGNTAIISSIDDDDTGKNAGAAYIFSILPDPPTIDGPSTGVAGKSYAYNFTSIHPDGDELSYFIDWGDGTYSDWFGPFNSGEPAKKSHVWENKGGFIIKAKSKDIYGTESAWSDPLPVIMPKTKICYNNLIKKILEFIREFLQN